MIPFLDVTENAVLEALRGYLSTRLAPATEVIRAQVNRVPEPKGPSWVLMTPLMRTRLATDVTDTQDIMLTATLHKGEMNVTAINGGTLVPGTALWGIEHGSVVSKFLTGTGGVGTYLVTPEQTLPSTTIYAGLAKVLRDTDMTIQLDVFGPTSGDIAQWMDTLIRSDDCCNALAATGLPIQPLYTDDPRQMPLINAESQWERRWIVDVHLHLAATVSIEQQFADQVEVDTFFMADDP